MMTLSHARRASQGVALLAALFVLMVMSILAIGLLMNVDDEQKMSKSAENSEMALRVAEAGIQVARSTFFDPGAPANLDDKLSSIDGFYKGGYFLTQLEAALRGKEKWTQWRYDQSVTGHNTESAITVPVFQVWGSTSDGTNGIWINNMFYASPIYGIVARGFYFPIQQNSGDTLVRARDETTGNEIVNNDWNGLIGNVNYWQGDKSLITDGTFTPDVAYAALISPMVSFSNYITPTGIIDPVLSRQILYFTYAGDDTAISGTTANGQNPDRTSTVRLRAVNAVCHGSGTAPFDDTDPYTPEPLKVLWEFDTGLHGGSSAPVVVDPDPDTIGDEILYFAVFAVRDLNLRSPDFREISSYNTTVNDASEQIYLFAIVDTTTAVGCDPADRGSYLVKWARPFPDPDVAEWTDYATEHATGTTGFNPPHVRRPADMYPALPEDDILADYRDGPGDILNVPLQYRAEGTRALDNQLNQVRGNVSNEGNAMVAKVLYRDANDHLTESFDQANAATKYNPLIDIYMMYTMFTRVTYLRNYGGWADPFFFEGPGGYYGGGFGWGPAGYRKQNTTQVRVFALRDRVVRDDDSWNWHSAKSRFPTFKWNVAAPPWDPDQREAPPDNRPGNGYGEYTWDTWYHGHIAPMINSLTTDQDGTAWADVGGTGAKLGGQENRYNIIYAYYKSGAFPHIGAEDNTLTGTLSPTIAQGSPKVFDTTTMSNLWANSVAMMMAFRDTWDDYMRGDQTNITAGAVGSAAANDVTGRNNLPKFQFGRSNPVEYYWTHKTAQGVGHTTATDFPETPTATTPEGRRALLVYETSTINAPYRTSTAKIGFPRPYTWDEGLWFLNVGSAPEVDDNSLFQQGWAGALPNGTAIANRDQTLDVDIEGETAALCRSCRFGRGLLVLPFNHDLSSGSPYGTAPNNVNGNDPYDREDLRLHGIDATSGQHVWAYHVPTTLRGDDANSTPAIANNLVFFAFKEMGIRRVRLVVLDADTGGVRQTPTVVDNNADALILPPTIANGAVYIATYDWAGTSGPFQAGQDSDQIRLFTLSPVLRLVSTGVYPFDNAFAEAPLGYRNYTGNNFRNITLLDHDSIFKTPPSDLTNPNGGVWKRRLQVWVTGQSSKWEEVRDVLEE